MSWLGDREREDPAYPGRPGDMDTTGWSILTPDERQKLVNEAEDKEARARRAYVGRHRKTT